MYRNFCEEVTGMTERSVCMVGFTLLPHASLEYMLVDAQEEVRMGTYEREWYVREVVW